MKVLFLCGAFDEVNQKEVIAHAKAPIEFSANTFQQRIINGFKHCDCDFRMLSAPFLGSFPNASDILMFKGFEASPVGYCYVPFNNIWGLRNYSRANSVKHKLNEFIVADDSEKLIVVYSPHTPFLEAAVYAKKRDSRIKICLIVPDLPQYMNLNDKQSLLYKIGKKYDISRFNRFNRYTDSFVLLTEPMNDVVNLQHRPYCVCEGIVDRIQLENYNEETISNHKQSVKYIVYTGKLIKKFGIEMLIDAMQLMTDSNIRLVICGSGDSADYIKKAAVKDNRILFKGQVTPKEAKKWMMQADVLVNPRPDNETYTRYSFPSKNIEYLLTGNPVVAFVLPGMNRIYSNFFFKISENSPEGIRSAVIAALNASDQEKAVKRQEVFSYFRNHLTSEAFCRQILEMNKDCS